MKPEKKRIRLKRKKKRKLWKINPISRAHSEKGYRRAKEKEGKQKEIEDEEGT